MSGILHMAPLLNALVDIPHTLITAYGKSMIRTEQPISFHRANAHMSTQMSNISATKLSDIQRLISFSFTLLQSTIFLN